MQESLLVCGASRNPRFLATAQKLKHFSLTITCAHHHNTYNQMKNLGKPAATISYIEESLLNCICIEPFTVTWTTGKIACIRKHETIHGARNNTYIFQSYFYIPNNFVNTYIQRQSIFILKWKTLRYVQQFLF